MQVFNIIREMNKLQSIVKKAKNLDLEAYEAGKLNYDVPTEAMESFARSRAEICGRCESNIVDPIESLQIDDELIPNISDRMCEECGCSLPYLLRQTIKGCKKGKW